jgi:UPF0176 protein
MPPQSTDAAIVVAALYHFAPLSDYREFREFLLQVATKQEVKGTLLLAPEGINGTIAGTRTGIDAVLAWLRGDPRFAKLEHKESCCDAQPFYRLKVRLKKEIVTLGVPGIDPNERVGTYVSPQEWNALIADPDVVLVDTRNDYEFEVGSFKGAVDPETRTFREFPDFVRAHMDAGKQKKVAMFCTGGIRCEKASALMLAEGFEEVYHLKGGILKYLEEIPEAESMWEGECFVFDERVTVGHGLGRGTYELCRGCRMPLSSTDKESFDYREGVCCPKCAADLTPAKAARLAERNKQSKLAQARNERHVGRVDQRLS